MDEVRRLHRLKIRPEMLEALLQNRKTHEIRKNDRDYQRGDVLEFERKCLWNDYEAMPVEDTNATEKFIVTHVLNADQFPEGLQSGYVILSLKKYDN